MSAIAILKLERSGFTAEQVDALAEYLDGQAASTTDLAEAKADLKADIARVEAELKADIRDLDRRMTLKLGGVTIMAVGAVAALVKLL